MLYSTQTLTASSRFGIKRAVEIIMDAGFPAVDLTMHSPCTYFMDDDYKQTATELRAMADARGVVFNQAHAPFGGGYDKYTTQLVPTFPKAFEFASICGVRNIIVHPLQKGRYYGNAEALFEMNMEFYTKLAPLARDFGLKIAIENMWQRNPVSQHICDDVCADPVELARYYDTLNDPEVFTVCLDVGHATLVREDAAAFIQALGKKRLTCLHVHDVDDAHDRHLPPYFGGAIAWDRVIDALVGIGYEGNFTCEADYFFQRKPPEIAPAAARLIAAIGHTLIKRFEERTAKKE